MSRKKKDKSEVRESMFAIRLSQNEMKMFKRICNILEMNKSEMMRYLVSLKYEELRKQTKIVFK